MAVAAATAAEIEFYDPPQGTSILALAAAAATSVAAAAFETLKIHARLLLLLPLLLHNKTDSLSLSVFFTVVISLVMPIEGRRRPSLLLHGLPLHILLFEPMSQKKWRFKQVWRPIP